MAIGERIQHILESQQFSREFLEGEIFPLAKSMEQVAQEGGNDSLRRKIICNLFYEPSTRTRISFETATTLLGGTFLSTENASEFSSAIKGESIRDTIKVINRYHHAAIVIRHKEEGAAKQASEVSKIPIINAGDGTGQHPTQALLDVYTIYDMLKSVDGARVGMVGDLAHGRTVNSLAYLLAKFNNISIDFISPKVFGVQQGIKDYLERHEVSFTEGKSLKEAAPNLDVIYMTRAQTERFELGSKHGPYSNESYKMSREILDVCPEQSIIMHPLPRNDELPEELDDDPRIVCFRQVENGLYIRMALLALLLG